MAGCELGLTRMDHRQLSDKLWSQQATRGHEDSLVSSGKGAIRSCQGV